MRSPRATAPALLAQADAHRRARPRRRRRARRARRRCSTASRSRRPCPQAARDVRRRRARRRRTRRGSRPKRSSSLWQIAAQGRADLAIAPDEAMGLSMTLLRMLAFEPATARRRRRERAAARARPPAPPARSDVRRSGAGAPRRRQRALRRARPPRPRTRAAAERAVGVAGVRREPRSSPAWPRELAAQTEMRKLDGNALTLALPAAHKHLAGKAYADRLRAALEQATGAQAAARVRSRRGGARFAAPSATRASANEATRADEAAFREEPFVRDVVSRFEGRVRPTRSSRADARTTDR